MLVRALLETPGLGLRVLAGEEALDRQIGGAFTTDLLDPSRYLSGSEIVLTGLMWWRAPADSEVFVSALAAAGVTALAAGDAALGSIPPDLVAACRRHRLPLLEVPVEVSFAAITELVMRAQLAGARADPAGVRRRLLAGARAEAGGRDTGEELAAAFAAASTGYALPGWVFAAAGRLVAGARPAPDARAVSGLAACCLSAARLPAVVTAGGSVFTLLRIAGHPSHRLASWFAAFAGDQAAWDPGQRACAAQITGLAAAHRAQVEEGRRPARRCMDELLRQSLEPAAGQAPAAGRPGRGGVAASGGGPAEGTTLLRALGFSPRQPVAAVAASLSGIPRPQPVARALLEEILPGAAAGVAGPEVVAAAPGAAVLRQVRAALGVLGRGAPGLGLAIGVSAPIAGSPGDGDGLTTARLVHAIADARLAARLAGLRGAGAQVVDGAQLGSAELLLALAPEEARRSFHSRVLAPLLSYDSEHGTELVRTLEVFLGCSASWTRAAARMYTHVNTLRYRIHRIEQLTGRDLSSLAGQADLLAALRLWSAAEDECADPGRGSGAEAAQ